MKIGFIGLGKMGLNMTTRLLKDHEIVVYNIQDKALLKAQKQETIKAVSIKDLIKNLPSPKII